MGKAGGKSDLDISILDALRRTMVQRTGDSTEGVKISVLSIPEFELLLGY